MKGHKRGRLLGFPTANIRLHTQYPEGVYISHTRIGGITYLSVTFIGPARTYGEHDYKAETYVFNFNKQVYGVWITITLLKKIRKNKIFPSEKALIKQMHEDVREANEYFLQG